MNTTESPHSYFSSESLSIKRGPEKGLLKFDIKVKNIENQNLLVLQFSENELKAFKTLLKIVKQNSYTNDELLKGSKQRLYEIWKPLSDYMITNGFNDWNFEKCYQSFKESLDIYKMVLSNSPNNSIASKVYPLFKIIYNFENKPKIDSESALERCETSIGSEISRNIITSDIPHSCFEQNVMQNYHHFELCFQLIAEYVENQLLYVLKFTDSEVNAYILLLQSIKDNNRLFITESSIKSRQKTDSEVWKPISDSMKKYNKCKKPKKCQQVFTESVQLYEQVLSKAPHRLIAAKVYPLFNIINNFDIKPYLKCHALKNKIQELEEEFGQNSGQSSEYFSTLNPISSVVQNVKQYNKKQKTTNHKIIERKSGLNNKTINSNQDVEQNKSLEINFNELKTKSNNYEKNNSTERKGNLKKDIQKSQNNNNSLKIRDHSESKPRKLNKLLNRSFNSISSTVKPLESYFDSEVFERNLDSNQLTLNYEIKVENIENRLLYVLEFNDNEVNDYKLLLQTVAENTHFSKIYTLNEWWSNNCVSNWDLISKLLLNDFKDNPQKCHQTFSHSVRLYQQVLGKVPNLLIASKVYPLFDIIRDFDLKYFIETDFYNNSQEMKSKSNKECQPSRDSLKQSNVLNKTLKISETNSIYINEEVLGQMTNICAKQESKEISNYFTQSENYFEKDSLKSQNIKNIFPENVMKPKSISTPFSLNYEIKEENSENRLLYLLEFNYREVNDYKLLLQTMDENIDLFKIYTFKEWPRNSCEYKWNLVSKLLLNEFKNNPQKCYEIFSDSVRLYQQALIKAPNRLIASKVYPLFDIIHSFDLKPFIETDFYDNIQEMKVRFEAKCGNSSRDTVNQSIISNKTQESSETITIYTNEKVLGQKINISAKQELKVVSKDLNESQEYLEKDSLKSEYTKLFNKIFKPKTASKRNSLNHEIKEENIENRNNFIETNYYNNFQEMMVQFETNCSPFSINTVNQSNISHKEVFDQKANTYKEVTNNINKVYCGTKPHIYFNKSVMNPKKGANSLTLNYEIKLENIENQLRFVLKFTDSEVNAYKLLLKSMEENVIFFISDYSKRNSNRTVWKRISVSLHEYQWNSDKCIQSFDQSVKLYKQVLRKAPNQLIASKAYPLFNSIHEFNLRPFLKIKTYNKLMHWINVFEMRCSQNCGHYSNQIQIYNGVTYYQ